MSESNSMAGHPVASSLPEPAERGKVLTSVAIGVVGLAVFGLVAAMLLSQSAPDTHKRIAQITLLRLPPPPPPKPEEKPPEPPKKQEVQVEQPRPVDQPQPAEAPPPGPLGLDSQGTGPGDGFGLAGRPGGRDITTIGGGGGSELSRTMYGNGAARFIAQELARDPKLKAEAYRIELRVWIGADGHFEREEIVKGTGDPQIDALIRDGLARLSPYRQAMPENTPQPLLIRVTSSDREG